MPVYEFSCGACSHEFEEFLPMSNSDGVGVRCSKCNSEDVGRCCSVPTLTGFSMHQDNFGYRAGHYMEKAQDCRRDAQAASHMGADPYGHPALESASYESDLALGEGIHHPFPLAD